MQTRKRSRANFSQQGRAQRLPQGPSFLASSSSRPPLAPLLQKWTPPSQKDLEFQLLQNKLIQAQRENRQQGLPQMQNLNTQAPNGALNRLLAQMEAGSENESQASLLALQQTHISQIQLTHALLQERQSTQKVLPGKCNSCCCSCDKARPTCN